MKNPDKIARGARTGKPYSQMTTAELREATREFDEDFAFRKGKPLTKADRELHRQAALRGRRGRPKLGQGAERINITMERGLLRRVDSAAAKAGLKRAQFVARVLEKALQSDAAA